MVDITDLSKANDLFNELAIIRRAIEMLDAGARIVRFGVGISLNSPVVDVPSQYMDTPPTMIAAIKNEFAARVATLEHDLAAMGVTGVEVSPRGRRTR